MSFINPFHKSHCLFCKAEFYPGECKIVSNLTPGKVMHHPPQNRLKHIFSRIWYESLTNSKYRAEFSSLECPKCKKLLPNIAKYISNVTIAIVGTSSSGKSYYTAALIHEIIERLQSEYDGYLHVVAWTQEHEQRYQDDYFKPVFLQQKRVLPTKSGPSPFEQPLIFQIVMQKKLSSPLRHINLIIYDASGEDVAQTNELIAYSEYVLNASAIICLVDPMTIPLIDKKLVGDLHPVGSHEHPTDTLNRLIQSFERKRGSETKLSLVTPIAITLSKSDLLRSLVKSDKHYSFLHNPPYDGSINLEEVKVINDEVEEIFKHFDEPHLLSLSRRFKNTNYFASSTIGFQPNAKGIYPTVAPCRCLDPLLWILWQLGILEAKK